MQYEDYNPAVANAVRAEVAGGTFCVAAVFTGITLASSGHLQGGMGLSMMLSATLPTLGVGLLLIFAGRILRAVNANSNPQAQLPREKD